MEDRRATIIVPRDPPGNVMRVGDEAVRRGARWRDPIAPARPAPAAPAALAARPDALRAEVRVELIPGIPHRRVAVADVHARVRSARRPSPRSGSSKSPDPRRPDRTARSPSETAAGSGGSRRAGRGRRWTTDVRMRRDSISGDTEPCTCTSVSRSAPGKRRQSDSSTFSPPRMPVSQSCTSTTRRPAESDRPTPRASSGMGGRLRPARRRPVACARPIAPTRTPSRARVRGG